MRVLMSTCGSRGNAAVGGGRTRRAAELVAAQFDTVAAAAEGCDALVATGVMPAGVWL
jgi:vancomycin aglycone glucosyltransferase